MRGGMPLLCVVSLLGVACERPTPRGMVARERPTVDVGSSRPPVATAAASRPSPVVWELKGADVVQAWSAAAKEPTSRVDLSAIVSGTERYLHESAMAAASPPRDIGWNYFNFPDVKDKASYRFLASAEDTDWPGKLVVFIVRNHFATYVGIAAFDQHGRYRGQLFAAGMEGGTGMSFERSARVFRSHVETTTEVFGGAEPEVAKMRFSLQADRLFLPL